MNKILIGVIGIGIAVFVGIYTFYKTDHQDQTQTMENLLIFVNVPDIFVNLQSVKNREKFLKISSSFVVQNQEDADRVTAMMPKILNDFQIYLRDLRSTDLKGSQGLLRVKVQLLMRANTQVSPTRITDILFREILVQ